MGNVFVEIQAEIKKMPSFSNQIRAKNQQCRHGGFFVGQSCKGVTDRGQHARFSSTFLKCRLFALKSCLKYTSKPIRVVDDIISLCL